MGIAREFRDKLTSFAEFLAQEGRVDYLIVIPQMHFGNDVKASCEVLN